MIALCTANAGDIGYETYKNCPRPDRALRYALALKKGGGAENPKHS